MRFERKVHKLSGSKFERRDSWVAFPPVVIIAPEGETRFPVHKHIINVK